MRKNSEMFRKAEFPCCDYLLSILKMDYTLILHRKLLIYREQSLPPFGNGQMPAC